MYLSDNVLHGTIKAFKATPDKSFGIINGEDGNGTCFFSHSTHRGKSERLEDFIREPKLGTPVRYVTEDSEKGIRASHWWFADEYVGQ